MTILPTKALGKWSIGLAVAMPILIAVGMYAVNFYEGVPAGDSIPADIVGRPGIAVPMVLGFLSGIAAFATGLITLIKDKERAIFVIVSTLFGALDIVWIILEIAFPH